MKRILTAFISAILFLAPVAAFEWGGLVDNNSTINIYSNTENPWGFKQANSVYLWASSPLNKDGNVYIKGEGMYQFVLNAPGTQISNLADLDLFKIAGDFQNNSGTISFALGRFFISDLSGVVFAQNCDGAYVKYAGQKFGISAYAGYTGLLNSNTVTMLNAEGKAFAPANKVYALSTPFMPVAATVSLPNLFLNQTLSISANVFTDFSDAKSNRYYGALSLSGPLSSKVYYTLITDFGTENFKGLMNYSKADMAIFASATKMITFSAEYASGNHAGMVPFLGVSSHPAYSASQDAETTGVLVPSVGANLALTDNMLLSTGVKFPFTCPEKEIKASGVQLDVNYLFTVLSDVQIGASVSGFKGFNGSELDKFSATLKAAVSF